MEKSQSKPRRSRRLASQLSLTPETKPSREKRSHLTESNSPNLFETCVSTSLETTVTPVISGTSAFTEKVPQLQDDIRTDPSVTVDTSILEVAPPRTDPETDVHLSEHLEFEFQNSEGVTPPVFVTAEATLSSAREIFYRPDGLPLPPGLIAIEQIVEDIPPSTLVQFGTRIHLHPSTTEVSSFSSQVPFESLGNLLDRLNMFENHQHLGLCQLTQLRRSFLLPFLQ